MKSYHIVRDPLDTDRERFQGNPDLHDVTRQPFKGEIPRRVLRDLERDGLEIEYMRVARGPSPCVRIRSLHVRPARQTH